MTKSKTINVKGSVITLIDKENDFISLTDIAKYRHRLSPLQLSIIGCEAEAP